MKPKTDPKYKIVFLDWYGTLSVSRFWGHLEDRITSKIESSLFGNLKPIIDPWMRGKHKSEDIIKELSDDTSLPYQMLLSEFIKSCENMKFVSEDIEGLVRKLRKKGTRVVIATDNMDSFTRWTIPAMNLQNIFDGILNSHDLKALKRDFDENGKTLFFGKFLKDFGVKHGESIIIDDGEDKDGKIQNSGIVYKKITYGEGLADELLALL